MQDKEDQGGLDSSHSASADVVMQCTGERPICARCQKQGKECVYANATTSWRARLDTDPPELPSPPSHSGGSGVSPVPDPPAIINIPPPKPSSLVAFDRSILPSRRHIHELLSHYFLYTNAAFPIFHIPTLQRQVDAVCFSDESVARFDIAVVLYALAIGSASLDQAGLSDPAMPLQTVDFFNHAVKYVIGLNGVESLQIQVARLIFVLYKPGYGNAWELAGSVARQAIGLGLHQEADTLGKKPLERDMRRRLFWINRSTTCNLKFMGDNRDDSLITDNAILPGEPSPLKVSSLQVYRLHQIQSEIHTRLYASTVAPPALWLDSMVNRLAQWRAMCPAGTGYASDHWQVVQHHATISMLYRPSRASSNPDRHGTMTALVSAREVIRRSKDLSRMGRVDFMDTLLDIQTCLALMERLAATTPGTSGIRNAFEGITEKVIRLIMATSSGSDPSRSPVNTLTAFLVHPLGEWSAEEWDERVAGVLRPLP
ncbi:hypothetical protein V865_007668 [Kwoniella europaea PYCC6329]|uniref:Transcription factor domain-containing protein n=1 Tax=Kwoniella europaea PYCC6329 TaxID=1423913 RepID=A0AAX4KSU9_9TREE